jgi:hypothetical protein
MDQENRKRARVPVHRNVNILIEEKVIQRQIINISMSGILCTSDSLFQRGALCKVNIVLGDNLQMNMEAVIVRVAEQETAINFTGMDQESFLHLMKFVQYNSGDPDKIESEIKMKTFIPDAAPYWISRAPSIE